MKPRRSTRGSAPRAFDRTFGNPEISPDLKFTEEAFRVELEHVAPGAYIAVGVQAAAANVDDLVAVITAHMPGDLFLHWGLGEESQQHPGTLSNTPWECPPEAVMPPGSYCVQSWAVGSAVRSPFGAYSDTIEIPLPRRPGHGLAFVVFDADKQCYYDHDSNAFFLDERLSMSTAARAQAAAENAARAQTDKIRAMAEAEAAEAARVANLQRERDAQLANAAANAAAQAREHAAAPATGGSAFERMMADEHNVFAGMSAYERYTNDPGNPFRNFAPPQPQLATATAARGSSGGGGGGGGFQAPTFQPSNGHAPVEPPHGHIKSNGHAAPPPVGSWPTADTAASYGSSHQFEPEPEPVYHEPTMTGGGSGGADGSVVATYTINLSTENGSSNGTCDVKLMATWPPSVSIKCSAGGVAAGQPLLLHWGVTDRRGGSWNSPYDNLVNVPANSRAPDAQSCESPLPNGETIVEFAPHDTGTSCMTMLIRTEDCKEWLRDRDGGDVFIDVSPALQAVAGAGGGAPPPQQQQQQQQQHHHQEQHHHHQQQHHHHQEQHHHHHEPSPPPTPKPAPMPAEQSGDHMALLSNWAGQDVNLQQHKGSNHERKNQWNTDGLPDAARRIVEGDRDSPSWRQKLQALEGVLCMDANHADMDALAYSSVYLFWVGVGAIACVEDGSHYRPNHHANASQKMYESIEAIERNASNAGGRFAEECRALIRRLHPRLPAFTAEFTQSVPLTRIRDIAHGKGDKHGKCREVRAEIKHTIQNKLHRCAGPEDLVATEKMLAKLTAPGTDYPEEFIEEFRIFHRELKDFFNASSVTDRLEKQCREGNPPGSVTEGVNRFVRAKATVDAIPGSNQSDPQLLAAIEECLHALCDLRRTVDHEINHGQLAGEPPDQRQQWRLAEIGLEDYAFVLLSRGINALGAESDPPRNELTGAEISSALRMLAAASDATALSSGGGAGEEFGHIAHEAGELANNLPGGEQGALRVRAVAERARRSAEDYCNLLSDLFDGRAAALGRSLGIDGHTVEVFTEGQIRASVVFQSAKLASHLLRAARTATGEAGWDCLVAGEVVGARLVSVPRLDPSDPTIRSLTADAPAVLLVRSADGDEEVSTCGPGVAGILLCHALPHLSHLALRARQAGVPLVAIEDPNLVNHASSLTSAPGVRFVAQPSNISLDAAEGGYSPTGGAGGGGAAAAPQRRAAALVADTSRAGWVTPLHELGQMPWHAGVAVAGSKAMACSVLSALATDPNSGFAAPTGAVLPFGSMEQAAHALGHAERLNFLVDALESVQTRPEEVASVCGELQDLVRQLRPSHEQLAALADPFAHDHAAKVMVRSTGNAEDLAGLSAAGLYDSISNVAPGNPEVLGSAVAEVWASLYTPRAVASRAAAGVGQRGAHMAVLVQQMLVPDVSFILMTRHPMTNDPNTAYAELALGHGETLASGAVRGTPWRVSMNRSNPGESQVHTYSSFGTALVPDLDGDGTLKSVAVNCAGHWLSTDDGARGQLAARLVHAGGFVESTLGSVDGGQLLAQDIEGCLTPDGQLWVVQARPQP